MLAKRQPHFEPRAMLNEVAAEVLRRDPHHDVRHTIDRDCSAYQFRLRTETGLPRAVAHDHFEVVGVLTGRESTATRERHAEDGSPERRAAPAGTTTGSSSSASDDLLFARDAQQTLEAFRLGACDGFAEACAAVVVA